MNALKLRNITNDSLDQEAKMARDLGLEKTGEFAQLLVAQLLPKLEESAKIGRSSYTLSDVPLGYKAAVQVAFKQLGFTVCSDYPQIHIYW